jgi:hypothetical protein
MKFAMKTLDKWEMQERNKVSGVTHLTQLTLSGVLSGVLWIPRAQSDYEHESVNMRACFY